MDSLVGTFESMPPDSSMRVRIVGCLGPIAMRQGDIEMNKVPSVTHSRTIFNL